MVHIEKVNHNRAFAKLCQHLQHCFAYSWLIAKEWFKAFKGKTNVLIHYNVLVTMLDLLDLERLVLLVGAKHLDMKWQSSLEVIPNRDYLSDQDLLTFSYGKFWLKIVYIKIGRCWLIFLKGFFISGIHWEWTLETQEGDCGDTAAKEQIIGVIESHFKR